MDWGQKNVPRMIFLDLDTLRTQNFKIVLLGDFEKKHRFSRTGGEKTISEWPKFVSETIFRTYWGYIWSKCALPSTKQNFFHKTLYHTLPYYFIHVHTICYLAILFHTITYVATRQLVCSKPCVFSPKIIHKVLRSRLMIFVEKSYNKFIFLWHDGTICAMSDPAPDSRPIRIVKDDKNLRFDYYIT